MNKTLPILILLSALALGACKISVGDTTNGNQKPSDTTTTEQPAK